jgi:hypothetical protein
MENFGINSILGTNFKSENSEGLSVYSLANTTKKEETDIDFILQLKSLRREKLLKIYVFFYNRCMDKIKLAIKYGKDCTMYYLPFKLYEYPDYNSIDCLEFIQNKLKELKFDTLINTKTSIFVDWKFIEIN